MLYCFDDVKILALDESISVTLSIVDIRRSQDHVLEMIIFFANNDYDDDDNDNISK